MPDPESKENTTLDPSARIQQADRKGIILISLPKWIAWAIIAWQIRLSIEALTGKYAFPSLLTRSWRQAQQIGLAAHNQPDQSGGACMMSQDDMIDVKDLPAHLRQAAPEDAPMKGEIVPLAELNRTHAFRILERSGGDKALAAKMLGINRDTLYRILKTFRHELIPTIAFAPFDP